MKQQMKNKVRNNLISIKLSDDLQNPVNALCKSRVITLIRIIYEIGSCNYITDPQVMIKPVMILVQQNKDKCGLIYTKTTESQKSNTTTPLILLLESPKNKLYTVHTSVCHYDLYAIEDCVSGLTRIAASSPEALTRVGKRRSITMICSVRCRRSRTTNTKEGNWTRYSFNTIILCIVKLRRKVVVH